MFDSLKSKLKGIFSKADKELDKDEIFGKENEQPTTPDKPVQQDYRGW